MKGSAAESWETRRGEITWTGSPDGAVHGQGGEVGELVGGKILESPALFVEASLESEGDFEELWQTDRRRQLGQGGRIEIAQVLAATIELDFHAESGLAELGMGLGRAAQDQALVATGQALLFIAVIEAKTDQGGSEASRPGAALLHQGHRSVSLSLEVAG